MGGVAKEDRSEDVIVHGESNRRDPFSSASLDEDVETAAGDVGRAGKSPPDEKGGGGDDMKGG